MRISTHKTRKLYRRLKRWFPYIIMAVIVCLAIICVVVLLEEIANGGESAAGTVWTHAFAAVWVD